MEFKDLVVKKHSIFFKLDSIDKIIEIDTNHNHSEPSEQKLNRQMLSNKLKRKAVEDIIYHPTKTFLPVKFTNFHSIIIILTYILFYILLGTEFTVYFIDGTEFTFPACNMVTGKYAYNI